MLRVRMLGEAVASIPVEQIRDVRSLKRHLHRYHGLPPRFRQRVLLHGECLEDTATLDAPTDLSLVLVPFADVSRQQASDLPGAACQGWIAEVETMMQLPQDPDSVGVGERQALTVASEKGHVEVVRLLLLGRP
ncbi:Kidins220 [Symbiodinium natans]|uniref:Kidins220 protein n=1 Tax=Symbiodinium natans TaxID=878477 RepID=A0A812S1D1_9DINO|nr:Kidins220 [Symbiodinium natans]